MGSKLLSRNALRDDVASVISSIGGHARLFTSCHCVLAPPGIPVKAREDNANGDNILEVVKLNWGKVDTSRPEARPWKHRFYAVCLLVTKFMQVSENRHKNVVDRMPSVYSSMMQCPCREATAPPCVELSQSRETRKCPLLAMY